MNLYNRINPMSKRVYKFTSAQHGISNLQNKRLKLSTIDDFNDPFDLCPLDTTDPVISNAVDAVIAHFRKTAAILCFSRNWDNLLLWSHYGASHTGVCLGFDIPEGDPGANYDTDVLYQPNLLQIRRPGDVNLDFANRLLRTKHESWSYEQEVRMFVGLNDPPDAEGAQLDRVRAAARAQGSYYWCTVPSDSEQERRGSSQTLWLRREVLVGRHAP